MRTSADRIAPLIPYFAVATGMYLIGSAWAALGIYHAGMLLVLLLGRGREHRQGKKRFPLWSLPVAMLIFAMSGVLLYVLWPLLGTQGESVARGLSRYGVTPTTWPILAVYFCIVNSVLEELFWRGQLGSDGSRPAANDVLFGGYHGFVMLGFASPIWALPVLIVAAFGGWLWRRLRCLSGGLLLPILTHVVADVSIVVAVHLRVFR